MSADERERVSSSKANGPNKRTQGSRGSKGPRDRNSRSQGGSGSRPRSGKGRPSGRGPDSRSRPPRGGSTRPPEQGQGGRPRKPLTVQPGGTLPRWVREEILRSTPKDRRDAALQELSKGLEAFASERHKQAAAAFRKAKDLAPRAATIREMLGLAAYQLGNWDESLKELRTYRRLTGSSTHMPVELDCLRALQRPDETIRKTWELYQELDSTRDTEDEMRVVYASHLLDRGHVGEAWSVIKPGRLIANAPEPAIRRWSVAARVAVAAGNQEAARRLVDAIRREAPDVPWIDDLERALN